MDVYRSVLEFEPEISERNVTCNFDVSRSSTFKNGLFATRLRICFDVLTITGALAPKEWRIASPILCETAAGLSIGL